MLCEKLFQGISEKKDATTYEVKYSMMEIYNEIATDLLNTDVNKKKRDGLKIRQHPKKGFYGKYSFFSVGNCNSTYFDLFS